MIVWYGSGYNIPNWLVCFCSAQRWQRDAKTGARMKYEGAVRGVADLILLIPKKDGLPSV